MDFFWKVKSWEEADLHLSQLRQAPFQRPFPALTLQRGIYLLRGPRQVGKSTWLKVLLSEQVNAGARCFYLSCENVRDHIELAEILKSVRELDLVLLDEVTFVDGWARAVKHEADRGTLPTLVATGSNAFDLRRGSERLPGRYGAGEDLELLPMTFAEFLAARHAAGWPALGRVEALELYFRIGGFPSAVIEAGVSGATPYRAMSTYRRWIVGDVVKAGRQEIYLKEVLGALALTMGSPLSLQKLAQRTQLGSHHTAQDYVQVLEDCFALRTLYALDENTGAFRFRKEKKFYFTDPLIFWIALEMSGFKAPENFSAHIAEAVAAEALSRRYPRVGYYSSRKGEVDFYSHKAWALEVKWSPVAANLSKAYLDLRMPQKIVWTHSNFLAEWPVDS